MKRKRKWWLWPLGALSCLSIIFAVSKLMGIPLSSIVGWGTLGVIGVFAIILFALLAFVIPVLLRALFREFVSNRERMSIILGSLGLCAIVVGWMGTILEARWSLFVVMSGFSMGCLAGAEYQEHLDLQNAAQLRNSNPD